MDKTNSINLEIIIFRKIMNIIIYSGSDLPAGRVGSEGLDLRVHWQSWMLFLLLWNYMRKYALNDIQFEAP